MSSHFLWVQTRIHREEDHRGDTMTSGIYSGEEEKAEERFEL